MRNLIILAIICAIGWQLYSRREAERASIASASEKSWIKSARSDAPTGATVAFRCDGRKYCSQMTSCQEATYFLKNCPGAKMDGNNDGVPCEQQWCR